ncbi:hypothetical protein D9613_010153 [Agrocybe pediades]|uniref:Uncharacterized protein n=1 Tax=Agrocybe pediades TaxID=84607 RepID=A0A8H4QX88_9AGAR|nr:hypothetical protein D9613_010153 [Agrocybe pediades]
MSHYVFPRIPLELVTEVVASVEDTQTLLQIGFVSRSFRDIVLPFIYHALIINKGTSAVKSLSLQNLSTNDNIRNCVKEIEYDSSLVDIAATREEELQNLLQDLLYLPNFPRIGTLRVYFPFLPDGEEIIGLSDPDQPFINHSRHFQRLLFQLCGRLHAGNNFHVKFFEIHNVIPCPNEGLNDPNFRQFLRPLKGMGISIIRADPDPDETQEAWHAFQAFTTQMVQVLQAPMELEYLSYGGDTIVCGAQERWEQWNALFFPRLRHLHLKGLLLDDVSPGKRVLSSKAIQFLLRHCDTLEDLTFESCSIAIDDSFTWSEILPVLEERMQKLVSFTFVPLPGRNYGGGNVLGGYSLLNPDTGVIPVTTYASSPTGVSDEDDGEEDKLALRRFLAHLRERRNESGETG